MARIIPSLYQTVGNPGLYKYVKKSQKKLNPQKPSPRSKHSRELVKSIIYRHLDGETFNSISRSTGVPSSTIEHWALGITRGDILREVEEEIRTKKGNSYVSKSVLK